MTVKNIFDFLDQKFPVETACDFDNVGLLVGNPEQEVTKALITLDCTIKTVKNALDSGCQLIITHHPVIFNPLKNVLKGSIVYEAVNNNLSVISMHTNLDIGVNGVNDSLCKLLSLQDIETVLADDGYALKKCSVSPISSEQLAEKLKSVLGGNIRYTDSTKPISKILVCSGSGGNFIKEAARFECDALITADVKHNQFLEAAHNDIALFDAGHFNTEDVVIEPLKEMLKKQFCEIEFICDHENVIKNR